MAIRKKSLSTRFAHLWAKESKNTKIFIVLIENFFKDLDTNQVFE